MEQQMILNPLNEGEGNDQLMMPRNNEASGANKKRQLSKHLSMTKTTREDKWERRRRQMLQERKHMMEGFLEEGRGEETAAGKAVGEYNNGRVRSLTDDDLDELKGSIELGFGFSEVDGGHKLRDTLPALDLYFAVNRQFSNLKLRSSPSPDSTPTTATTPSSFAESPSSQRSAGSSDSWTILSPGDDPAEVKTRLRHWAQVVACSVRQCCHAPNPEQTENGLR